MKQLSELLNTEFGNSLTAKRAQVRNEILVRCADPYRVVNPVRLPFCPAWGRLTKGVV